MKIIKQSWEWVQKPVLPLEIIEKIGRTCYKSEHRIGSGSADRFIKMILTRHHESVIEHVNASVRFITNRGVSHELVRHRLCSYSQESTRYITYDSEMQFIEPVWWNEKDYSNERKNIWLNAMDGAEKSYLQAISSGDKPEQAREVLPHSLKTELVMTANLREWRHVFELRCTNFAHPQIRALMRDCLNGFAQEIPIIFDEIQSLYK